MKKTLLSTALLCLLNASAYSDDTTSQALQAPTPTVPVETTVTVPVAPKPAPPPVINCNYAIPATIKTIDETTLSTWASRAIIQSFEFTPAEFDEQLKTLKSCYTDLGWKGFYDALEKSGNIKSIQTQALTVTSQVDGQLTIKPVKDNQWKVSLPLQVVYQNTKERLTQLLTIDLLIGRKINGDLGIMQIIALPKDAAANVPEVNAAQ